MCYQNKTLLEIFNSRNDISEYVFHFTKSATARESFNSIIQSKEIKDINGNGYICFTESPITMMSDMFDLFSRYPEPMYAPYGIGIKKENFFKMGGRPVIYGTEEDGEKLKSIDMGWRFELLRPKIHDFSWLREWRIEKSQIDLNIDNCITVVPTIKDELDLVLNLHDIDIDAEPEDGGSTIFYHGEFDRIFKCITIEKIKELKLLSNQEIEEQLKQCNEQESIFLGSEWK